MPLYRIIPALISLMLAAFVNCLAQTPIKNYDQQWKKVDELISKKNLPKSALAEVNKIYVLAKQEKQEAQLIKALLYRIRLQQATREENEVTGIKETENEIASAKEPVVSILKSLLATMYWNYFQNNRWKLYSRSATTRFNKTDIRTWSTTDFHKKISELYLQSIQQEKLLQQTRLEPFDALLLKGNVRHLRPTLFDLLAHRALMYFKNDERDLARPAYSFTIDQSLAFDPAAQFIRHSFPTKDSSSLQHKALLIYQKLLSFHLHDKQPDALLDADLERLQFVYHYAVHENKKELYRAALLQLTTLYRNHPAATQAWYLLAASYNNDADAYQPLGDTSHRYDRVKAKEICEKVLQQKDSSEGKVNCLQLLQQIETKSLQFHLEKINLPAIPFRALVQYRNIDRLFLRIIRADTKLKEKMLTNWGEKNWTDLLSAPSLRSWEQPLPATGDYQLHAVEIKIDALSSGEYILLAAADEFSNNMEMGAQLFYVSPISYINQGNDYFVLHRQTGQPLANASVQLWYQQYDYKNYKYIVQKGPLYLADSNGYFKLSKNEKSIPDKRSENYKLEISWKNEHLSLDDWNYEYVYYKNRQESDQPVETTRIFYFTDRSIYRPGQTVYFKGIAVKNNPTGKNQVAAAFTTKLFLENVNQEKIDSVTVTINEFGSFSGTFLIPPGLLNGNFYISDQENYGRTTFSVEEYKRPKFFISYEKQKDSYRVNDKIRVTGLAKAYAGNVVDGALVKYRVVRIPRFIYPWYFRRGWQPPVSQMEIAHGETKTDPEGRFVVAFDAVPDNSIDKKLNPVFDYKIYADVTDINGETRSGETELSVSYTSYLLKMSIPSALSADSLKSIYVRTENLAGEFVPAAATITIKKLKEETRLIRSRFWKRPDQFVMSKEEFVSYFPNDEYDNELDYRSWEKGEPVFEKKDSVRASGQWNLDNRFFAPGFYEIECRTAGKDGEEITDVRYLELIDEKTNRLNYPQYLWTKGASPVEPGEKTSVVLGTAADHVFLIQQIHKKNKDTVSYTFSELPAGKTPFVFSASEADRGGYGVTFFFIQNNRFFHFNDIIKVPWTNKDLVIEYATFRDNVLPGSNEKWKLKITGYKKEQVAAELLLSMYDASLDQFIQHSWSKPSVWPYYTSVSYWNSNQNFNELLSQPKWMLPVKTYPLLKNYDQLIIYPVRNLQYMYDRDNPDFTKMSAQGISEAFAEDEKSDEVVAVNGMQEKRKKETASIADRTKQEQADQQNPEEKQMPEIFNSTIQIRKNFSETAFFFPDLKTDSSGAIEFSFSMPEALTRWKFQALAHTKDLAMAYSTREIVTQKQVMVQSNAPRFLREGDKIEFSVKIINLTESELTGQAELQLFDAATNESVSGWFRNMFPNQYFTVAAGQSVAVLFPIEVPFLFNKTLSWRVVAKAGSYSDGEEALLPVLSNRMLVTETLPLNLRGTGTKTFTFDKLLNAGASETLQNHSLTVEYTSNPVWYAVQALPYLMDYPYECTEQTWNRYYANALATKIVNNTPRIHEVFTKWLQDTPQQSMESTLQKNPELKSILLQETPWVLQAKNDEQQKKNLALLLDLKKMTDELKSILEKLKQMQSPNGGFVWFKGGPDNATITQYIVSGIGHLKKLGVKTDPLKPVLQAAIPYLDRQIKKRYDELKKHKSAISSYTPGFYEIQYLYMRSFFTDINIPSSTLPAYTFFRSRAQRTWMKQSVYMQGMIALALYRTGDNQTPGVILKSLKETSITNEEQGMYWKENSGGWLWYQAPVETQSLLIEVFSEIGQDKKTVDELKTWLLKNKQTTSWKTTKATAEACYALLLQGTDWLSGQPVVEVSLGNTILKSTDARQEAGTGYFKKIIPGPLVTSAMGKISVTQTSSGIPAVQNRITWGSVYWQYFEDLDKITQAATPLRLNKKIFVETTTDRGPVLTPLTEEKNLKVGDKIRVRIELRVDRNMEFVHMKDMRASCLEPINVLSGYRWQGGLGYYESVKDASTNFFFDYLPKGTYVFEYTLFVSHAGHFSNGITSIQCMYAPEFAAHSEGIRFEVE